MTPRAPVPPAAPVGDRAGLRLAFVGLGATGAVVPATLPSFAGALTPAGQVFLAVPMLFGGLLVGVLLAPAVASVAGPSRTVAAGAATQGVAVVVMAAAGDELALLAGAGLAGAGFGVVESAAVGLVRAEQTGRAGRRLTSLTMFTAATAAAVPLVVVAAGDGFRVVLVACAVPHLAAATRLVGCRAASSDGHAALRQLTPGREPAPPCRTPPSGLVLPGLALFCYVGGESIVAGWSAELPRRLLNLDPAAAAVGTSLFWALLFGGRLLALAALRHGASERVVLVTTQSAACVLLALAAGTADEAPLLSTGLLLAGVPLLAPSYGLLLSAGTSALGARSASTAAALVAVGAAGGALFTLVAARAQELLGKGPSATIAVAALAVAGSVAAASAGVVASRAQPPDTNAPLPDVRKEA